MKRKTEGGVTKVVVDSDDIMEVMKKVLAKDKTFSPKEVAAEFKKMGMIPGYDGEPDVDADGMLVVVDEPPPEPTLNDDIAEGMGIIFGGVEEGPMRAELGWFADDKHDRDDPTIQKRFEDKGTYTISYLDIDEIDHLLFFLDLLDKGIGPWYYYRSKHVFSQACERRLMVLSEEDKAEQEDQALMDEALKKRGKRDGRA